MPKDDAVDRNLQGMDDLDFVGWNNAHNDPELPVTMLLLICIDPRTKMPPPTNAAARMMELLMVVVLVLVSDNPPPPPKEAAPPVEALASGLSPYIAAGSVITPNAGTRCHPWPRRGSLPARKCPPGLGCVALGHGHLGRLHTRRQLLTGRLRSSAGDQVK